MQPDPITPPAASAPAPPSPARTWLGWAVLVVACLAVFALYLRPGFLFTLADQLWACF